MAATTTHSIFSTLGCVLTISYCCTQWTEARLVK